MTQQQQLRKLVQAMPRERLEQLVYEVYDVLYWTGDYPNMFSADADRDSDDIEDVADIFFRFGLEPDDGDKENCPVCGDTENDCA